MKAARPPLLTPVRRLGACLVLSGAAAAQVPTTLQDFFHPGTQPNTVVDVLLGAQETCVGCHAGYDVNHAPVDLWQTSMMAQSARDPVFHAALAIAEQDADFSGESCLRCHAPMAWLDGRSTPSDGSALTGKDYEGVSCSVCHRMVDPVYDPGANPFEDQAILDPMALGGSIPTSPHNGTYVIDPNDRRRGPFDLGNFFFHAWLESPFHRESLLCATCHDVSNPVFDRVGGSTPASSDTYAANTNNQAHGTQDKYDMFPIERTWSEWSQSAFAAGPIDLGGRFGGNNPLVSSCQDCHMPDSTGQACSLNPPIRPDLPLHYFYGVNNWVQKAIVNLDGTGMIWDGSGDSGLTMQEAQDAIDRNEAFLQLAADLEATPADDTLTVRVTNQTGHKLPTGYHEGRRMWINVQFRDDQDQIVAEHGFYDASTATLTTVDTKVYQAKHGLDPTWAATVGLPAGESFHFVLNNSVVLDNRIPPRGFTNAGFESVQAQPVGATYADGQYWDDTDYTIPCDAVTATVSLYYQVTSREYIEFLRDTNTTNNRGQIAYDQWVATGRSAPVQMATTTVDVPDCNGNGMLDHCDITMGGSFDVNTNGVPDECDTWVQPPGSRPGPVRVFTVPHPVGSTSSLTVRATGLTPGSRAVFVAVDRTAGAPGAPLEGAAALEGLLRGGRVLQAGAAGARGEAELVLERGEALPGDGLALRVVDPVAGRASGVLHATWR